MADKCLYCLAVEELETYPDIPEHWRELALMSLGVSGGQCECSHEQR